MRENPPQLLAHRPRDAYGRSNCLSAIRAIQNTVNIIELDLRQTVDGVLVALHDAELEAVSDVHGRIEHLTIEQTLKIPLKPLIAGNTEAPVETIPSLEQVITCCGDTVGMYLDCREVAVEPLLDILDALPRPHALLVCSPVTTLLQAIAEQHPGVRRVTTWRRHHSEIHNLPTFATDVEVFANDLSAELVRALQDADFRVGALTLGETDADVHWRRAATLGVDWLMTDNPNAAARVLKT